MGRRGDSATFSLSPEHKAMLEELALEHDCKWGNKANVSKLLEKIAEREIVLGEPLPETRLIKALTLVEKALETALEAIKQVRTWK